MRFLVLIFLLMPIFSLSQSFTGFQWKDDEVVFKSVEMTVKDGKTKKEVFNGYKDAVITIDQSGDDPRLATVTVKLSGYFETTTGYVQQFEMTSESGSTQIKYTIMDGKKFCYFIIVYPLLATKPSKIIVSTATDLTSKTSKDLLFTLTGFE